MALKLYAAGDLSIAVICCTSRPGQLASTPDGIPRLINTGLAYNFQRWYSLVWHFSNPSRLCCLALHFVDAYINGSCSGLYHKWDFFCPHKDLRCFLCWKAWMSFAWPNLYSTIRQFACTPTHSSAETGYALGCPKGLFVCQSRYVYHIACFLVMLDTEGRLTEDFFDAHFSVRFGCFLRCSSIFFPHCLRHSATRQNNCYRSFSLSADARGTQYQSTGFFPPQPTW